MVGVQHHRPVIRRQAAAFTLIELLVVIVVIGLLIAALLGVGNVVIYNQKVRNTQAIMRNVGLAIDQFAKEDPLRLIYDGKNPTFGPYPPYTLASYAVGSVGGSIEPNGWTDLGQRLSRDLSGQSPPPAEPNTYVDIEQGNSNDDIRALYAYLMVYAPGTLVQVPESAKKPLPDRSDGRPEVVNPTGSGTDPAGPGAVDVLGIYDAWGVPLDYFLYVKVEYGLLPNGTPGVKITDRMPVLRSRGISREVYDVQRADPTAPRDASKWIFSQQFPSPVADATNADFWRDGVYDGDQDDNGWARAVASQEDYGYVPDERDGTP